MEQEHRIAYKAGITRNPSDFLCEDGNLAECINLATDNEELKPMVQPKTKFSTLPIEQGHEYDDQPPYLIYTHKYKDETRYIFLSRTQDHTYVVDWYTENNGSLVLRGTLMRDATHEMEIEMDQEDLEEYSRKVTSVGLVLILVDKYGEGLLFFKWEPSDYSKSIVIPYPDPDFRLKHSNVFVTSMAEPGNALDGDDLNNQDEWNDLVVGLYTKNLKQIAENKDFCKPFLVRTAIELYDGTYYYISQPMMMFACVQENSFVRKYSDEVGLHTYHFALHVKQSVDLTAYSDFIKDVVIFVSAGVEPHELNTDQPFGGFSDSSHPRNPYTDHVTYNDILDKMTYMIETFAGDGLLEKPLKQKSTDDIKLELESDSVFYKLCSIGLNSMDWTDTRKFIIPHTLENIRNQERLDTDDYYSRCSLHPDFVFSYNERMNMANVRRGFFEGFGKFMPFSAKMVAHATYEENTKTSYRFVVKIETDEGDKIVEHTETTNYYNGIYFFYPDPRARHVWIFDNLGYCVCNKDLKEHRGLNGAYYFKGLPGYDGKEETESGTAPSPTPDIDLVEYLPNCILTTGVYNPFTVTSEGYNHVGTGKVLAMSTITQALSQGQFGQYPLLVFSESGIWAMAVDNTGLYQAIYPMSRDVCINPASIIQTDGVVFFVSKKGLMLIAGNEVRCVSEQMNGKTFNTNTLSPLATGTDWAGIVSACQDSTSFLDYIRSTDLFMAYDYIDSRIIMTKPGKGYSFVYNIADGTISKTVLPAVMTNAVNNYPDYLMQGTVTVNNTPQSRIYSFYEKPREEEVNSRTLAFLLTRPMKLAGPVSQASLRQLMNVGMWDNGTDLAPLSCVKTEIYLSSDMKTWYNDISRHGAAARYYRLALYIKMLPTERLSGTILSEQERRAHNMR